VARNLPPVMMPLNASCYAAFGLRLRLNMHTFLMKLIGPCLAACGVGVTGSSQRTNSSSYLKVHELKCAPPRQSSTWSLSSGSEQYGLLEDLRTYSNR
jgi:hypothetical protein